MAYVQSPALPSVGFPDKCTGDGYLWKVGNGSTWADAPLVRVSLAATNSVHITGIPAPHASLNGVYDPTDEVYGGVTVFCKRGNVDRWLEYNALSSKWFITQTSDRGSGVAYVQSPVLPSVVLPDQCTGDVLFLEGGKWFYLGGRSIG